jgi:histidinol phosphate phosphatase hisN-like protein
MPVLTSEERARLRAHLLETLVAGPTRTTRHNAVRNAQLLARGDEDKMLGFSFEDLDIQEVMDAVAALCGCSADPAETEGPGYIDPDRTIDELEAMAGRLQAAARRGERVLLCTGHPTGPLPLYQAVARELAEAGCKILTPREGERLGRDHHGGSLKVLFLDGVGVLADGARLLHTHEAWPMWRLLEAAETPDLVMADHGFAGGAVEAGVETIAFNDVNDPAIAVAKARRKIDVVVPLDDNVPPSLYDPLTAVLVRAIRANR